MTVLATFNPSYGSGQTVALGAASARVSVGPGQKTLCITSLNAVQCYVRVGDSTVVASAADYPIPANGQVTITKFQDHDYVAFIAPDGGGSLHIMTGEGF